MSWAPQQGPQTCAQCGAMIDPLALACPYCKFTTPQGVIAHRQQQAHAQHQAQWAAHAHHVQTSVAGARMKSTATQSLVFGILGLILFCTPLGIVGILQWFRARGMAREAHAKIPTVATAGLVLSIVSLVTSVGGIALLNRDLAEDEAAAEKRAAAIEARLGSRPNATVLDRQTACDLAEAHIWREGDGRIANHLVRNVDCMGTVSVEGERADLDLVRVKSSTQKYDSHVCFRRGGKWFVERVQSTSCF